MRQKLRQETSGDGVISLMSLGSSPGQKVKHKKVDVKENVQLYVTKY